MAVTSVSSVPVQFSAGNTVNLTLAFADFSAATWTLALVFSRVGYSPVTFAGSASGTSFTVTLTSTITAAMPAGTWNWTAYVTSGGERTTADSGTVQILPDLSQTRTRSTSRIQLDAINAAITSIVSGKFSTVSFNGQTFTRQNLDMLMRQRTDLAADVYKEEQAEKVALGATTNTRIPIQFVNP